MSQIHIVHPHQLTHDKAHAAAQKVADKIASEYGLAYEWEGDTLHFERGGVTGNMVVGPAQVEMTLKLGFLMSAFAHTIEAKIRENLKKIFG